MKKNFYANLGGIIIFYTIIIVGILLLNFRFSYLNQNKNLNYNNEAIAMNE